MNCSSHFATQEHANGFLSVQHPRLFRVLANISSIAHSIFLFHSFSLSFGLAFLSHIIPFSFRIYDARILYLKIVLRFLPPILSLSTVLFVCLFVYLCFNIYIPFGKLYCCQHKNGTKIDQRKCYRGNSITLMATKILKYTIKIWTK